MKCLRVVGFLGFLDGVHLGGGGARCCTKSCHLKSNKGLGIKERMVVVVGGGATCSPGVPRGTPGATCNLVQPGQPWIASNKHKGDLFQGVGGGHLAFHLKVPPRYHQGTTNVLPRYHQGTTRVSLPLGWGAWWCYGPPGWCLLGQLPLRNPAGSVEGACGGVFECVQVCVAF